VIDQAEALAWLRRAIATGRVAHAYLITGPRGVGKRTFALEVARALNCLSPDPADRPDRTCQACRLIDRGVHPDVRTVRRAPERRMISLRPPPTPGPQRDYVDNVEFIQADAQLRPAMGRKKVYLILSAEELAPDAADRLLKTLEEPPPLVHFLLTAVERGGVQPTIVSRCQEIRLKATPRLQHASSPEELQRQQAYLEQLLAILSGSRLDRLWLARRLVDRWSTQPEVVRETLRAWLVWWHDVLLLQVGLQHRIAKTHPEAHTAAATLSPRAAQNAAGLIQQTLTDLDTNVNPRLALDLLALQLPSLERPNHVDGGAHL
jgi:DNA polymerase III gamma/tau subunit